jgi:copper chaperone CopZ
MRTRSPIALLAPLAVALAAALGACGATTSSAGFSGEQHNAAQAVANLQSDATSGDQKKICSNDLAGGVVTRLGGQGACEKAIKEQLAQISNLETTVESVHISPDGKTATAQVKSIHEGKSRVSGVTLVKEGGSWRLSALQ